MISSVPGSPTIYLIDSDSAIQITPNSTTSELYIARSSDFAILPYPSDEPVPEAKYACQAHYTDGYTATHCPKVTLCSVCVNDAFEVHPEIGCEER